MPCLAIHLAVAEEYLKQHEEENREEFLVGTIAPDVPQIEIAQNIYGAGEDKNSRHFGEINSNTIDIIEYVKKKVDLQKFLLQNEIETSFQKAYFLHLICDDLFYKEFITNDDVKKMTFEEVSDKMRNDYNRITPILIKKYHLKIPTIIKDIISGHSEGPLELFDETYIEQFIDKMRQLNLGEFRLKYFNNR